MHVYYSKSKVVGNPKIVFKVYILMYVNACAVFRDVRHSFGSTTLSQKRPRTFDMAVTYNRLFIRDFSSE